MSESESRSKRLSSFKVRQIVTAWPLVTWLIFFLNFNSTSHMPAFSRLPPSTPSSELQHQTRTNSQLFSSFARKASTFRTEGSRCANASRASGNFFFLSFLSPTIIIYRHYAPGTRTTTTSCHHHTTEHHTNTNTKPDKQELETLRRVSSLRYIFLSLLLFHWYYYCL